MKSPDAVNTYPDPLRNRLGLLQGVALGSIYGVLLRGYILLDEYLQKRFLVPSTSNPGAFSRQISFTHTLAYTSAVMTVAFLVLGPMVIGFLTVRRMEAIKPASFWTWIVAPWLSVVCMMAVIALFAWEGAICVVMAFPLTLLFASLGGVTAGIVTRRRRISTAATACIALLPMLLAPAETLLPSPTEVRTVHSQVLIHANPAVVWHNIERVPAISPSELKPNWTHRIGFPRPVEATLSYEGVGAVRHASFEHGLLFIETVTDWEPGRRIAFTIKADTDHIPPNTLDEHVTIGGRYFDVLDGEYTLERLSNGDVMLRLTSHQRLSTDFNGYAGLWTDAVMQNLQTSILQVIQHRCETTPIQQ